MWIVREETCLRLSEGCHACSCESGQLYKSVQGMIGLQIGHSVCENQSTFSICVSDLHVEAGVTADDIGLSIAIGSQKVLHQGHSHNHVHLQIQLDCIFKCTHHTARSTLVQMHIVHTSLYLQVHSSRVKYHPLTHQSDTLLTRFVPLVLHYHQVLSLYTSFTHAMD